MHGETIEGYSLLVLSLLVLVIGPALHQLARATGTLLAPLDGFVYVTMGGMVLFYILPETYHLSGWPVFIALALGLLGPGWVEHRLEDLARQAHLRLCLWCNSPGRRAVVQGRFAWSCARLFVDRSRYKPNDLWRAGTAARASTGYGFCYGDYGAVYTAGLGCQHRIVTMSLPSMKYCTDPFSISALWDVERGRLKVDSRYERLRSNN